jgi:ATPase subunit of ABC transporter with duplicated ATPase domains
MSLIGDDMLWGSCAGNYDSYVKTRGELEEAQMKKYKWEQEQIADMKEYIARFGHGSAKLARQAQSKEKTLEKMVSCTQFFLFIVTDVA